MSKLVESLVGVKI